MGTESTCSHSRDRLAKTLKRFSLTYEQHQLLHSTGVGPLASHVAAKRKPFTMILALLTAVFALQAGRGLLSNGSYMFWGICGAACAYWCWRRHVKTRALHDALVAFAADDGEAQLTPGTLADELRLGFNLHYDEHQALHSGNAELAAARLIGRCRANTQNSIKHAVFLSVVFGLLRIVSSAFSDGSVLRGVGSWLSITIVVTMCVIVIAVGDKATIARVEKLLRMHQSDVAVGGESGNDSHR